MVIIRRIASIIGLLATLIILGFCFWSAVRDPLASLPQPEHNLASDAFIQPPDETTAPHRQISHVILHSLHLGDIGLAVNLPNPLPAGKLPILFVMGGLGSGQNNIRYITDAGPNAVIGYDWPMPVQFYSGYSVLTQMPELYGHIMTIPGQVASSLAWLKAQPWADGEHISLLGFSMGALAAPAVQDISQHDGAMINWTILAYGGSPFGSLFAVNPHIKPGWLRLPMAWLIDLLLAPLEPAKHLAQLKGRFLVLEGKNDSLIPATARANLREAVPEPKTIITIEGDHMGVGQDKKVLLQKIITLSRQWLSEVGAVNIY